MWSELILFFDVDDMIEFIMLVEFVDVYDCDFEVVIVYSDWCDMGVVEEKKCCFDGMSCYIVVVNEYDWL